jgi:pimeloyl-ACP methyl ester carboxylesterase
MRGPIARSATGAVLLCLVASSPLAAQAPSGSGGTSALRVDHYVGVVSSAPSMEGETAQIYVRERVLPGTVLRPGDLDDRVVLFVHGAGTPAEVAFDPPDPGASWMVFLAEYGYDVFSVDMEGYGRSTRPTVMNDPCNLSEASQADFIPSLIPAPCAPSYGLPATTIESDWNDLDAVVDYIRELRGADRVHLMGWSLGGPRAGGYTVQHPEKVASLVLLSPAYSRRRSSAPPEQLREGAAFTKQSKADFDALWDRQLGCPAQFEPEVRAAVWSAMLDSDPVGATWGTGVRRAPRTSTWGWTPEDVAANDTPTLLVSPQTDGQVPPQSVRDLYEDLGASKKVLVDLACSSHNAMWETHRALLYDASLQWIRDGAVNDVESGEVRLGY